MARKILKIVVVDERPGMGLAAALQALPAVKVCAEAGTAAEAMEAVAEHQPDFLLLDLSLPRLGGLALVRALRRLHGALPVVAVAPDGTRERAASALKAGARAFLLREGAGKLFPSAAAAIQRGRPYVDRRLESARMIRPRRPAATA